MLERLESTPRYQIILEQIKNFILQELHPGDRLPPEKEIATQLGVSRPSVREVLKSLETLGIIEIRRGEGTFVRLFNFDPILSSLHYGISFNKNDLTDIFEVRKALECSFIGEAIRTISPDRMRHLRDLLKKMEQRVQQGENFAVEDSKFHRAIFEALNNRLLLELLDVFWKLLKNSEALNEPKLAESLANHEKVLKAIENKDVKGAGKILAEHFKYGEEKIEVWRKENQKEVKMCKTEDVRKDF